MLPKKTFDLHGYHTCSKAYKKFVAIKNWNINFWHAIHNIYIYDNKKIEEVFEHLTGKIVLGEQHTEPLKAVLKNEYVHLDNSASFKEIGAYVTFQKNSQQEPYLNLEFKFIDSQNTRESNYKNPKTNTHGPYETFVLNIHIFCGKSALNFTKEIQNILADYLKRLFNGIIGFYFNEIKQADYLNKSYNIATDTKTYSCGQLDFLEELKYRLLHDSDKILLEDMNHNIVESLSLSNFNRTIIFSRGTTKAIYKLGPPDVGSLVIKFGQ